LLLRHANPARSEVPLIRGTRGEASLLPKIVIARLVRAIHFLLAVIRHKAKLDRPQKAGDDIQG